MIRLSALSALAALSLSGCTTIPNDPGVPTTAAPPETPVALRQPVTVGDVVVTPMKVVEDSRCPMNARCVWAGRVVVETRIDGAGWRDTANVTLGEVYGTHQRTFALVSVTPEVMTGQEISPQSYRFVYERRDDRMGGPPPAP